MEKKKKKFKLIKYFFVTLYLCWLFTLLLLQVLSYITGSGISFSSLIYWTILVGWIYLIWKLRLTSSFSFKAGLFLFVISTIFTILRLLLVAETIMRLSFIGFLIGIIQALIEYKRLNVKKTS